MKRTLLATTAAAVLGLSMSLAAAQSTGPDTGTSEKRAQPSTPGKAPGTAAPRGNTGQTMQCHPAGTPNAQLQEPSGVAPKGQRHMNSQVQEQQPSGAAPKGQQHMNTQLQEQPSGQPKVQQHLQQGQLQQQQNRQERLNGQNRETNQPPARTGSVNQPNRQQPSQAAQPSQNTQTRTQTARVPPAQITEQQRTQIHERISRENLHRVDHANFSISIGTVVPRMVALYELPPTVVEIVPEYTGFEYVVVGDDLLIIDPVSLEIVAVLPA